MAPAYKLVVLHAQRFQKATAAMVATVATAAVIIEAPSVVTLTKAAAATPPSYNQASQVSFGGPATSALAILTSWRAAAVALDQALHSFSAAEVVPVVTAALVLNWTQ